MSGTIDDPESLTNPVADLTAALADRDAVMAVQSARIAELERRLGLDSSNSSQPPSSDGPVTASQAARWVTQAARCGASFKAQHQSSWFDPGSLCTHGLAGW